ncbi:GNAT family N-acetyltransferase [Streptomyces sp. NPDC006544]|uniref:GNAT family N-acetyltransferase n=1 Tax=Streptomyces sp. NPDC006544 TaxID=3154583 RepID=UPI0033A5FC24
MDIVIRAAAAAEYEELGELTAQAYLRDELLDFAEDDPYLDRLRDVAGRAADAEVIVAEYEGTLLGNVTFAPPGSPLAQIAGPGEAEFRMLAVSPQARGRGAGEALVRACMVRAQDLDGVTHLALSTTEKMLGAHRIYDRLGFVRTPERDWYPVPGLPLLTYRVEL